MPLERPVGASARLDRRDEDYRPGLPFYRFWTVLEPPASPAENRFVGQFEQMHESRCFRASEGRLGCISCHDPHRLPEPEERDGLLPAALPGVPRRSGLQPAGDGPLGEAATTIASLPYAVVWRLRTSSTSPRRIIASLATRTRKIGPRRPYRRSADGRQPVVVFHRDLMDDRDRAEAERDIGVAVCRDGREGAATALPRLRTAVAGAPDDVDAWEAQGFALGQLNLGKEGLAAFKTALSLAPDRESALTGRRIPRIPSGTTSGSHRVLASWPSRSAPGARTTTPNWHRSIFRFATGTPRPTLAGRPSVSIPRTLLIRKLLIRSAYPTGEPRSGAPRTRYASRI